MGDATLASVIQAINTLQTSSNLEERSVADKWLRFWQLSPEAWEATIRLLTEQSLPLDIRLMGAIFLRTKLLYDFVQLPITAHETLCTSLLNLIEVFKNCPRRAIFKTLALGFADLSIHTSRSWNNFLDVLYEKLCPIQDNISSWLCCLSAFPQENMKERLLADPKDLKTHAEILTSRYQWVSSQIVNILHTSVSRVDLVLEALECFLQWATFMFRACHLAKVTLFPPAISEAYFNLAKAKHLDSTFSNRVGDCLGQVVWLASKIPEAHDALLEKTLEELGSSGGHIRLALMESLECNDDETTLRLATIYTDACCGSIDKICFLFWTEKTFVNELFGIFLKLTSIQFDLEDENRGANGIASITLDFWEKFIVKISLQKERLNSFCTQPLEKDNAEHSSLLKKTASSCKDLFFIEMISDNSFDQMKYTQCVSELNKLFDFLFQALIELCSLPKCNLEGQQCPSLYEFYRFRHSVVNVLLQLTRIYTPEGLVVKLAQSYNTPPRDTSYLSIEEHQEKHFYLMSQLLKEKFFDHSTEEDDLSINSDGNYVGSARRKMPHAPTNHPDFSQSLTQFLFWSAQVLLASPPMTLLNSFTRISAAELLFSAFSQTLCDTKEESLCKILECLAQQVFHADLITREPDSDILKCSAQYKIEIEKKKRDDVVTLLSSRFLLCETAADALRQICCSNLNFTFLKNILKELYSALCMFPNLYEKSYCFILEGLCVIVASIQEDNDFVQWCSQLLNPCIEATLVTENILCKAKQLDRLSLILQSLACDKKERREALGEFVTLKLWPTVEHLWKTYPQSGVLVEACGRVTKHAVRCVKPDVFKHLFGPLVSQVIANAKICLHSTFMYIAEWLVTEYVDYADARSTLQTLFEELVWIGVVTLKNQLNNKETLDENFVEDFFSLFARVLRYEPTIPGNSKCLSEAFSLVTPTLQNTSDGALSMACAFVENCVWIVYNNEVEEGYLHHEKEALKYAVKNLDTAIKKNLSDIVIEIFRILNNVPPKRVLRLLSSVLWEFRNGYSEDLKKALLVAFQCLPPSVIPNESYKSEVLMDILQGGLHQRMEELHERCRRFNLRRCEAEATRV